MLIRTYSDADLEACRGLWVALNQHHRDIYDAPTIGGDDPGRQFDEHLALVGAEHVFLAVDDDRVVGMVGYMPEEREVEPIVVAPSHRGQGVGEGLLRHVMDFAASQGVGRLTVRPVARNAHAIAFFHQAGFDTLGRLELAVHLKPPSSEWVPGLELHGLPFDS